MSVSRRADCINEILIAVDALKGTVSGIAEKYKDVFGTGIQESVARLVLGMAVSAFEELGKTPQEIHTFLDEIRAESEAMKAVMKRFQ